MSDRERIQIRVTDDELEAWAKITAGPPLALADLYLALEEHGVQAGLDTAAIESLTDPLARESAKPSECRVAIGKPATPSLPAAILLEEPEGLLPGTMREDGSLDFRERRMIVPVVLGESIAQWMPPVEGKPGESVRGETIEAAPANQIDLRLGESVRLDEHGRVISLRDGARSLDPNGTLDVLDLHLHPGSVDPKSGNLETRGSLDIARDVQAEMTARAQGDLRVGGNVDGGNVEAGGAIEIAGGAIGRANGTVRAGSDLSVRHALGISLFAKGRIQVARSVSTSKLYAREVEVDGKILSDSIQAETRIKVQSAGSPSGGPCVLRVAIPLEPENFDPALRPARLAGATTRRGTRPKNGSDRRKSRKQSGRSPRATKGKGERVQHLDYQIDLDMRLDWRRRQRALQRKAVIEIEKVAHAGCRLDFGGISRILKIDVRNKTYRLDPKSNEIVGEENA